MRIAKLSSLQKKCKIKNQIKNGKHFKTTIALLIYDSEHLDENNLLPIGFKLFIETLILCGHINQHS